MINDKFLQNTGAVRDICQDICCELDDLSTNEVLEECDRKKISEFYKLARNNTDKLTELGFFNKTNSAKDKKEIVNLISEILKQEEYAREFVKKIWACEISDINNFNQNNFKLCVKKLPYDIKNLESTITQAFNEKPIAYQTNLISNSNVFLSNISMQEEALSMPFGIIYQVNENSFVMASDKSTSFSIKQKDFIADNVQEEVFGDLKVCIKGSAVKIKTPNQIINKNVKNPLYSNNNVVVLDAKYSKPIGIFCYGYNIKKVNLLKRKLSFIAKKLNVPLININMLKFYRNNKDYFSSNNVARKVFNSYVDILANDLLTYTKYDFKQGAKRLIGLNTNLRYNFIFKFALNINNFIEDKEMNEADTADYIVEMFLKAIEKHNALTKKREKANGAPLFFPDDNTFIALPKDFLKENS